MVTLVQIVEEFSNPLLVSAFVIGSVVVGVVLNYIIIKVLRYFSKGEEARTVRAIVKHLGIALQVALPVFILLLLLNFSSLLQDGYKHQLSTLSTVLAISAVTFVLVKLMYVFEEVLLQKYDISKADNVKERKVTTQVRFLKKLFIVIIFIISLSILFLSIDSLSSVGAGLLSSAGVAGIIIGFAAQKSIANLMAGLQIAFTQPIRIDDAVVLEGEWGWVEEINLTYVVVVRIWDWRRLVLPITYFIEKPFQNWTRNSGELLGAVYLYTDFRIPVEDIRAEAKRILEQEPLWNRNKWAVQVSDTTEQTMEIRILMTATNSPATYDLRCIVRERLIHFINTNYPEYFPRSRVEINRVAKEQKSAFDLIEQ